MSFLFFLVFFLIVGTIFLSLNKDRQKQHDNLLRTLASRIKFSIYKVSCSNFISGARDKNYFFKSCDLYLTEDAIIILGYLKIGSVMRLAIPIILTKEQESYRRNFPFAKIVTPKKMNINSFNEEVFIEFGESSFRSTNVEMRLKNLFDDDKRKIENVGL